MKSVVTVVMSALLAIAPCIASATDQHGNGYQGPDAIERSQSGPDWMEICANVPIPNGWVVTSIRPGCGTGFGLYEIRKVDPVLRPSMYMCAMTAVPTNWVVTAIQGSCTSGVARYQADYVAPNSTPRSMCNVPASSVPTGWIVKQVGQGCGLPGYQYWQIQEARPEYGILEVCNVAPIPSGWVIVGQRPGCISPNSLLTIRYMP